MPGTVPSEPLRSRLARRRLLVVTGKGGVGKSAVAATLGRLLAGSPAPATGQPRRVLVFEVDPRENLHQMLGLPPSGGEIADAGGGLYLQNLKPRQVLDRIVAERIPLEAIRRRVQASPVYQQFAEGAPGLKEVAILGHALRLVRGLDPDAFGQKFDLVILDAPATGHGVSLLAAPRLLSEVIRRGPFGEMGAELAEFVADPEQAGIVVVTTPEEMPVHEALELRRGLAERLDREPELLVINAVYPPFPRGESPGDDPVLALWQDRRMLQEREIERLERDWAGPRLELPKLPEDRGPELVATLTRCLERELAAWR
ncbi:MAG TPA: ArsA-related P-loop ATPase [Thermoanaerobaculia bacterium]|nr:ArsA-related P-loop ATPase [Thermoanaerobaculia bacterium]